MHVLLSLQVLLWPPEIQSDKKKNVCRKRWTGQKEAVWSFHLSSCIKQASKYYSEIPVVEIPDPSLCSLYLCEESGKNPEKKPPTLLTSIGPNFCLGAEQKSMFVCVRSMTASLPSEQGWLLVWAPLICYWHFMHGEGDLLLCLLIDLPPRNVPVNQLSLFAVTLVDLGGLFFQRILQTSAWCTSTGFVLIDIDYKQA